LKKLTVKKRGPGRPGVKESKKSFTISLRPTEKDAICKKYDSLTEAIKTLVPKRK